jgi:hypothetical protein
VREQIVGGLISLDQESIFAVDHRKVARRRLVRQGHLAVDIGIFGVGIVLVLASMFFPSALDIHNLTLLALATVALFAIGAYAFWYDYWALRRINSVSVTTTGLHPPFKPKHHPLKGDWFLPYKEILAMLPVAEKGGFVPAYDVRLRDESNFQINALDLLVYVGEKEVRRYAKTLAVIREEIQRPVNQDSAIHGDDIVIPRQRFHIS